MMDIALSADGVPVHFDAAGTGAPAFVFVQGWSCNRTYWSRQLAHFAERYQVVAIDLAATGTPGSAAGRGRCRLSATTSRPSSRSWSCGI